MRVSSGTHSDDVLLCLNQQRAPFNLSTTATLLSPLTACVSPPSPLSASAYVTCVGCILLVALFSCLQVYTNRLRRAIAAFYHPKVNKVNTR